MRLSEQQVKVQSYCKTINALITEDFQIFIKPVGARCNLRCGYCYYLEKSSLYENGVKVLMDDETLENCIKQHYLAASGDTVLFTWHGGGAFAGGY